jgi:uncharacterized membrane protein YgcG
MKMETDTESLDIKRTEFAAIVWLTLFGQNVKGSPLVALDQLVLVVTEHRVPQTFTMLDLDLLSEYLSNDGRGGGEHRGSDGEHQGLRVEEGNHQDSKGGSSAGGGWGAYTTSQNSEFFPPFHTHRHSVNLSSSTMTYVTI